MCCNFDIFSKVSIFALVCIVALACSLSLTHSLLPGRDERLAEYMNPNWQHISDISHFDLTICICINVLQLTKPRKLLDQTRDGVQRDSSRIMRLDLANLLMTLGFSTVTVSITLRFLPTSMTPFTSPRFEGDALLHSILFERLLRRNFPNFWEHAQGWYYREQGWRRGENIRPPTICNFLYCVNFIPHKWKYSPHAFPQCKRTVIKYAYDRTDVPDKYHFAQQCFRTFGIGSL